MKAPLQNVLSDDMSQSVPEFCSRWWVDDEDDDVETRLDVIAPCLLQNFDQLNARTSGVMHTFRLAGQVPCESAHRVDQDRNQRAQQTT